MSGYAFANALGCLLVLTAVLMVSLKSVRAAVAACAVQSLALCGVIALAGVAAGSEELLARSATTLVLKAVAVPAIILFALRKVGGSGARVAPVVGTPQIMAVFALELAVCFGIVSLAAPASAEGAVPVLAISLGLFFMGLTAIVAQRDIFGQMLGYLLMECGTHALLVFLAPAMPEFAELCVSAVSVLVVVAMCAFAVYVGRVTGGRDTDLLHELKG